MLCQQPDRLAYSKEQWAGLKTVAMIEETQEKNGILSTDRCFFISSLSVVQSHWLIENGLHWTLDVVFNEDKSRVRKDNAGENMAIIRHITLNMLNNTKKQYKNVGLKALRKKAGWGNNTLSEILRKNFYWDSRVYFTSSTSVHSLSLCMLNFLRNPKIPEMLVSCNLKLRMALYYNIHRSFKQ